MLVLRPFPLPYNCRPFCASINKMCPKVSEKPKRGYFLDSGMLKIFPSKLRVIASSLNAVSAYKRFCRNALLSDRRGSLYLLFQVTLIIPVGLFTSFPFFILHSILQQSKQIHDDPESGGLLFAVFCGSSFSSVIRYDQTFAFKCLSENS